MEQIYMYLTNITVRQAACLFIFELLWKKHYGVQYWDNLNHSEVNSDHWDLSLYRDENNEVMNDRRGYNYWDWICTAV